MITRRILITSSAKMTLSITLRSLKKKRARNKKLKTKKEYQILLKRNKKSQIFFQDDKVNMLIKCRHTVTLTNDNFFNNNF